MPKFATHSVPQSHSSVLIDWPRFGLVPGHPALFNFSVPLWFSPHARDLANWAACELWAWRSAGLPLLGSIMWLLADHPLCRELQSATRYPLAVCEDATCLEYALCPLPWYATGATARVLPFLTHEHEEKIWLPITWFSQGTTWMIYTSFTRQPHQQSAIQSALYVRELSVCSISVLLLFLPFSFATSPKNLRGLS